MIHVSWKEASTRLSNAEDLAKLAFGLKHAKLNSPIIVYFEFENPDHLSDFGLALNRADLNMEIRELEETKAEHENTLEQLKKKITSRKSYLRKLTKTKTN